MAKAVATTYTPEDRIADGSIRVTFPESAQHVIPEDYLRERIAEFLHSNLAHAQYSKCEYVVCVGDAGDPHIKEFIEWCIPSKGMHAVPFWVKELDVDGVLYPTQKYSLKPLQGGTVCKETLELLASCIASNRSVSATEVPRPQKVSKPVVFDTDQLQLFFRACADEIKHHRTDACLTDAALVRIYQSVHATVSKHDAEAFVQTLIERNYLVSAGTRLREFMFGPLVHNFLPRSSAEPIGQIKKGERFSNEALAQAVLQKRRLQQNLAKAQVRADAAEAQCLELEARVAALEAQLQAQPDIAQLVQEGVAAELQRLLSED